MIQESLYDMNSLV